MTNTGARSGHSQKLNPS
uniref:Uncharacterized protein n=1 Tax=Anguilla anguilla TaxID=7936 RepID=A0A0E9XZ09_ANGAN